MNKFTYWQRAKVAFQYIMPQLYLTQLAGWFAQQKWGAVTHFVIKVFAKKYNVDMSEAKKENFSDYESFNQFFIHELKTTREKSMKIQPHFAYLLTRRRSHLTI